MGIKDEATEVAAEMMNEGELEKASELITAFQNWETTRKFAVDERKRCKDNVDAKLASLKEVMEVGHSNDQQRINKLTVIEMRWQDLEDARTERREVMSAMKDNMKLAETKIRDLITAIKSPQLDLFSGSSSTIDNPPNPEEDEEDDDQEDEDDENEAA